MSILVHGQRSERSLAGARRAEGPSVREVCLLGVRQPSTSWTSGDRLEWGGRLYRVEATQSRADDAGVGEGTRYVYLTPGSVRPGA
jgi:hypothetical protein